MAMESWPTSDGGLIVAGISISSANVYSAWIIKLNSEGNYEWQKKFDSGTGSWINSVAVTTNGYVIAGITGNNGHDAWVAKLESDGDIEWQRKFGGADNEELYSIKQLSDGTFVAAGSICVGGGNYCDGIVTRIDQNGTIQWTKKYGTTQYHERILNLEQPSGNEITCTGAIEDFGVQVIRTWVLRLDLNGVILGSTGYTYSTWFTTANTSIATSDGRLILAMTGISPWVIKLNSSGTVQWQNNTYPLLMVHHGGMVAF
jgi:hypothetical protein